MENVKIIDTKKLYDKYKGKGLFYCTITSCGRGDLNQTRILGRYNIKDLENRNWDWSDCDDDAQLEYFDVAWVSHSVPFNRRWRTIYNFFDKIKGEKK